MKAAIISQGSISSQMVAEAMRKYFDVDTIDLRNIEVRLGKESGIFYQGKEFPLYDCIYLKGSFRYANLLRSIATLLENKIPYMPLSINSFTIVHNKLLTHLTLQQHNIPMPRTYVTSTIDAAKLLLKKVRFPIVMKFPEGTQGKGVMFADSFSSASSMLDALGALKQPFIVQEYIETSGTDIRALVVGEKVVAAMRRKAQKEEKRANIHAGGIGTAIQLDRAAEKIAIDTARALGADVCGVDILESALGPLVIEANISPGLQGLSKVCAGIDIPDQIARFFNEKTNEKITQQKKEAAAEVLKDLSVEKRPHQEVVTQLHFRADRILLPELVTKVAKFNDRKDYILRIQKGKVEIEELK
ncbi:RimK family alpha-L-glutamate ligase [Candidatus Woesearchaeota archaeon]|nr:RimK family alpha-L-glutamate ligase [Candidatus Woesearchaeota archaeon]